MMPNGDPWDGFFYPTLTLLIDSDMLDFLTSDTFDARLAPSRWFFLKHMFVSLVPP